jgi:MoxR-like ATPase
MIAMTTTLSLASIKPSLDKLQALENELAASLIERDEVIRASLVALLARQHLVILGPPGTGKSALVTELARRITAGKLVEAELVFLDEIFKASSAIRNALLKIANERAFHNGGQGIQVPLITLFGASNEMPQGNEFEALWNRFLLRFRVGYVTDTGFAKFIRVASAKLGANYDGHNSNGGQPVTLLQSELAALQQSAAQVAIPNALVDLISLRSR